MPNQPTLPELHKTEEIQLAKLRGLEDEFAVASPDERPKIQSYIDAVAKDIHALEVQIQNLKLHGRAATQQ